MNFDVDKEIGEIKEAKAGNICLDLDVIREEEKYDGYYAIVTNVFDEGEDRGKFGDAQIIDIYYGLWRVEDSFSVTKGELDTRPFFLSRKDRIKAHLLICFVSLVIVRLIQKRTGFKHSPEKLIEAMNSISCSLEGGNLYLFDYRSDIADDLAEAFGLDFSALKLTRAEIKKNRGGEKWLISTITFCQSTKPATHLVAMGAGLSSENELSKSSYSRWLWSVSFTQLPSLSVVFGLNDDI